MTEVCVALGIRETEYYRVHTRAVSDIATILAASLPQPSVQSDRAVRETFASIRMAAPGLGTAPLYGQAAEIALLAGHLAATTGGQGGRLVLIIGDPGVGKTRLAEEVARLAAEQGGWLLVGGYSRDGATFGPWMEVLRLALDGLSPAELAQAIGPYQRDLTQILPELGLRHSAAADPAQTPESAPMGVLTPADYRLRLCTTVF